MPVYTGPTSTSGKTDPYVGGSESPVRPTPDTEVIIPSSKAGIDACCNCDISCTYDLPVFADETSQANRRTNDYSTFEYNIGSVSVVTAVLTKIGIDGSTISTHTINDNTYGRLYTTLKSDLWAFQMDWYLVATLIGYGRYKMNITVTTFGGIPITSQDTQNYILKPYSCAEAHRTVKIRAEQKGYFENGIDFTGLSYQGYIPKTQFLSQRTTWSQEIRVNGWFYRSGRILESDNVMLTNGGQQQVQARTIKKYTLKIDHSSAYVTDFILDKMLTSGAVYISDYNTNSIETYDNVRVRPIDYADPQINRLNTNEFQQVELQQWSENNRIRYK